MKMNKNVMVVAVALVAFASCKPEVKAPTEAEIDTKVTEKVEARKAEMATMCDETLLMEANAAADKVLVAGSSTPAPVASAAPAPAPAPKPKPQAAPTPKPVVKEPVKTNSKSDRFNNQGNGKTVTKEATEKKAERFENTTDKKVVTPEATEKKGERFKK